MEEMKVTKSKETTEKASLSVVEHLKFNGGLKTDILTSVKMADTISALFSVMPDYYGCKVMINDGRDPIVANMMPIGSLYVNLYFKDMGPVEEGSGFKKNLKTHTETKDGGASLGERLFRLTGGQGHRAYSLTPETYEMLEEFSRNGSRTRWAELTREYTVPTSVYGKEEIMVEIVGLNLNAIITKIYGDKTEEGRYEYVAFPSTMIPTTSGEFIMQVIQLDLSTVRELQNSLGLYSAATPGIHSCR